jgi:hypothetical protein
VHVSTRKCGKCGGDVTTEVDDWLRDIDRTYAGWSLPKKASSCGLLYAGLYWEAEPFYDEGYLADPSQSARRPILITAGVIGPVLSRSSSGAE